MKEEQELKYQKKWADVFAQHKPKVLSYWYKYRYFNDIERICQFDKNKKVLDIGCGISSILHFISGELTGIDPLANEYKKIYTYPNNIKIINAKGEKIPFPDKYFDIIFSSNSLDHTDDIYKTLSETFRVLKDDGYFILAVEFFKEKIQREEQHPHCLTLEDIYNLLSEFEVIFQKKAPWVGLREFVNYNEESTEQEIILILRKKINYKIVELKNDPWSQQLINEIKKSPHYQTALLWKENVNIEPEKTPYYQWLLDLLKKEGKIWGGILKTTKDILNQYQIFKQMYNNAPNWTPDPVHKRYINNELLYFGDYPVKIKNNGDFELYDGRHRIAILLALNLPLKITICMRELEWNTIKEGLKNIYPDKSLYQPIPHPDYQDWKQGRNNEKEECLKHLIKKYNIESVLDLGICHGYTLYYLRDFLIEGTGIESNLERFQIANVILNKCKFKCHNKDIYEFIKDYTSKVDGVFALSVLHHFMKQNPIEKFNDLLIQISNKCDFFIYELPIKTEPLYRWMYQEIRDDIDNYIQKKTRFQSTESIEINGRYLHLLKK